MLVEAQIAVSEISKSERALAKIARSLLGGPFDLVSRVSKVGYGGL